LNTKVITNNRPILLGRCGENEATLIKFPINVFFPFVNATSFSLVHQRHGDVAPYPCEISQGDGFINWSIKSADVANQGNGVAQLTAYNEEGLVAKTVAFTTVVTDSLGYVTPPEPQQAWVDQVVGYANQAHLAATQASESAAAIQNLGVRAETGDTIAVRKEIDSDTGVVTLVFTIQPMDAATKKYVDEKTVVDTSLKVGGTDHPVTSKVIWQLFEYIGRNYALLDIIYIAEYKGNDDDSTDFYYVKSNFSQGKYLLCRDSVTGFLFPLIGHQEADTENAIVESFTFGGFYNNGLVRLTCANDVGHSDDDDWWIPAQVWTRTFTSNVIPAPEES